MPWYAYVALALFIIAPFDAFYQYNKLVKRREELRRKQRQQEEARQAAPPQDHDNEDAEGEGS